MYRLKIETVDRVGDEAAITVDKLLDEDGVRHVIVSMMQYEGHVAALLAYAKQREEEAAKRLKRHDGDGGKHS